MIIFSSIVNNLTLWKHLFISIFCSIYLGKSGGVDEKVVCQQDQEHESTGY